MLNIQDLIAVSGLAVGTIISVVSLIFQRKQGLPDRNTISPAAFSA
jgi:hypothetical protein